MPDILVASDAEWVHESLRSLLAGPDTTVRSVLQGAEVRTAVAERTPDLVILDLQIGNMGGMATCLDLRLEESGDRLPRVRVLMLLDRRPDVFLARRCDADGWLVKPVTPVKLRRAVDALLEGRPYRDESYMPTPVATGSRPPG